MVDDPVDLDRRRETAEQIATEIRRLRVEVEKDQAALKARQDKLEAFLISAPAADWLEAVEKARYLIGLFADGPGGDDPRRQRLIRAVLRDFERLLNEA